MGETENKQNKLSDRSCEGDEQVRKRVTGKALWTGGQGRCPQTGCFVGGQSGMKGKRKVKEWRGGRYG